MNRTPAADVPVERAFDGDGLHARQPKAIHSALTVLEEVARCGPGVTAREISANLRMSRATAYRLLNLLVQEEYLVRLGDLSGFALGRKVVELADRVAPGRPPQAVRSIVASMRLHVRGGVHLASYVGSAVRVIDEDPDYRLSDPARLARELEVSAMGRLLLAEQGRQPLTGTSRARRSDGFGDDVLARGWAVQVGAFDPGRGCLAVPIRDDQGRLVAALSACTAREIVLHPGRLLDELRDKAAQLGPLLS